jgi:predicted glutamine amidotransferase
MCRWLAYSGPPILMSELLFKPCNSLIRQSLSAQRARVPTNGDGFGLGWYGAEPRPGLFRDTLPAWNDCNLRDLSAQIRSGLFFAHVRASTDTATSRENCHPFRHAGTLFMHNGQIGNYPKLRRRLDQLIPDALYDQRLGTTDSEAMFLLALANGLLTDPADALARTIHQVQDVMSAEGADEPLRITAAFSDGTRLVAARYSSDHASPSLYCATGSGVSVEDCTVRMRPGHGAVMVLSEPLDENELGWQEIPEGHVLYADRNSVSVTPLPL